MKVDDRTKCDRMTFISQEYFDELCVENYEVFDMPSPEEALLETLKQLQCSSTTDNTYNLTHLTLTYPDESGREIRNAIRSFREALCCVRQFDGATGGRMDIESKLDVVLHSLHNRHNNSLFVNLFLVEDGFSVYFLLLHRVQKEAWSNITETILRTVYSLTSYVDTSNDTKNSIVHVDKYQLPHDLVLNSALLETQTAFHVSTHLLTLPLTNIMEREVGNIECVISRIFLILSIVHASILRCEENKKLWMAIRTDTTSFSSVLLSSLRLSMDRSESTAVDIRCLVCRIITTICTFDDFRTTGSASVTMVQSGHSNVQTLFQDGAVDIIHALVCCDNEEVVNDASAITFSALRAMAIQDDVVQCMLKIGAIDSAAKVLQKAMEMSEYHPLEQLVAAILGLFRNASANDNIKTILCIGRYKSTVPYTIQAMDIYRTSALLQEHGCGLIAAMALRKPKNATALIMAGAHKSIVAAMQQHTASVTLQRQAALAIRNLVARSPELRSIVLSECDTEESLRTIGAAHLGCQDEVYAALRDLGLEARSVHILRSEDGTVTVEERRSVFGERNPNFRPEYTTSESNMTSLEN
jgi:hypothetical protein